MERKHLFTALDALVSREKDLSFRLGRRCAKDLRAVWRRDLDETLAAINGIANYMGISREREEAWFADDTQPTEAQ